MKYSPLISINLSVNNPEVSYSYLDDLLLIPLGLALVVRLTPPEVLESARAQAQQAASKLISYTAAAFFVAIWLVVAWVLVSWVVSVVRT